ncbi:MAG: hypothetical protein FJZ04_02290 [Candidatus Moranbacteria bacterium]|nr:hypothetical protein [Candidatus Moranbacteria bacterium]
MFVIKLFLIFVTVCLLSETSPASGLNDGECGSCDWNVWYFQMIQDDLEKDLESQSKTSRYNLGRLRVELDINLECAQKVCKGNPNKLKGIKKNYQNAFTILNSGELRSPRPLVDPLPPYLRR